MAVSDRLAVMDRGSIVQFAAPQSIYTAPVNAFVARFLGGFSLIQGIARDDRFNVPGTDNYVSHSSGSLNGSAMLVVRPEDGRPPSDYPDNNIVGEVVDSAFHGRCWRLQVKVGTDLVRIDWPRKELTGSSLTFSLPPERCTILPA